MSDDRFMEGRHTGSRSKLFKRTGWGNNGNIWNIPFDWLGVRILIAGVFIGNCEPCRARATEKSTKPSILQSRKEGLSLSIILWSDLKSVLQNTGGMLLLGGYTHRVAKMWSGILAVVHRREMSTETYGEEGIGESSGTEAYCLWPTHDPLL